MSRERKRIGGEKLKPDKGEGDEGEAEPDCAGAGLQQLQADAEGDHEPGEGESENVTIWEGEDKLVGSNGSKHCPDIAAWRLQSNGETLKHRVNRECQHRENIPLKRKHVQTKIKWN